MSKICLTALVTISLAATACSGVNGLNVGTDPDAGPNGSYSGYTLNPSVTDQNPHVGGDSSYPSSVADQGKVPPPPDKVNGR